VQAVSTEIGRLAGVQTVDVDLPSGMVSVTTEAPLDRADNAPPVDEAGYTLVGGPRSCRGGCRGGCSQAGTSPSRCTHLCARSPPHGRQWGNRAWHTRRRCPVVAPTLERPDHDHHRTDAARVRPSS
jgi:copper chaperone CopZ